MKKTAVNLPASVRQRLLNLATERKEDFGLVLTRYGLERFLYRLSYGHRQDDLAPLRFSSYAGTNTRFTCRAQCWSSASNADRSAAGSSAQRE